MFVQLRRVVYLLVLLQIFSNVVAGDADMKGQDAIDGEAHHRKQFDHLTEKLEGVMKDLSGKVKECQDYGARAEKAASEAERIASEIEARMGDSGAGRVGKDEIEKAKRTAEETNDVAKNAMETAKETTRLVSNTRDAVGQLNVYHRAYLYYWRRYSGVATFQGARGLPLSRKMGEVRKSGKAALEKAGHLMIKARHDNDEARQCAMETENFARSAENAALRLMLAVGEKASVSRMLSTRA